MQVLTMLDTNLKKAYGFKQLLPSLEANFADLLKKKHLNALETLIASNYLFLYAYIQDKCPATETAQYFYEGIQDFATRSLNQLAQFAQANPSLDRAFNGFVNSLEGDFDHFLDNGRSKSFIQIFVPASKMEDEETYKQVMVDFLVVGEKLRFIPCHIKFTHYPDKRFFMGWVNVGKQE